MVGKGLPAPSPIYLGHADAGHSLLLPPPSDLGWWRQLPILLQPNDGHALKAGCNQRDQLLGSVGHQPRKRLQSTRMLPREKQPHSFGKERMRGHRNAEGAEKASGREGQASSKNNARTGIT